GDSRVSTGFNGSKREEKPPDCGFQWFRRKKVWRIRSLEFDGWWFGWKLRVRWMIQRTEDW
ncbi:hypothetical protein U1Q18_000770, partial [Sarracenia purpurea var. burkii]